MARPGFRVALVEDLRATARFRGERVEVRSRWDAVCRTVRLAWVTDSFLAQVCYRAAVACRGRGIRVAPSVLNRLAVATGQVSIDPRAVVAPGLYLPHGQVVVGGATSVGPGAVLRPFVTLGPREGEVSGPDLGPHVRVGTGAVVRGPVRIGAGARIGANAVVEVDVPRRSTAVGVPARVLGTQR